jgi:hypothetical protein
MKINLEEVEMNKIQILPGPSVHEDQLGVGEDGHCRFSHTGWRGT